MEGKRESWLDERIELTKTTGGFLYRMVPRGVGWWYTLGSATMVTFILLVVTAVFAHGSHAVFWSGMAFLGFLQVTAVVLNLLPIPVLDGGLILFLVIEAIRKKPVSRKVMEVSQSIGAAVLITLIVVVSYNDIMRMFFSK